MLVKFLGAFPKYWLNIVMRLNEILYVKNHNNDKCPYNKKQTNKIVLTLEYFQRTIFEWVRDHRVHHKFSESPADPHNAKRGLFFSHCGWIMKKKHPLVVEKGKKLDLADLERDEIVKFHDR